MRELASISSGEFLASSNPIARFVSSSAIDYVSTSDFNSVALNYAEMLLVGDFLVILVPPDFYDTIADVVVCCFSSISLFSSSWVPTTSES